MGSVFPFPTRIRSIGRSPGALIALLLAGTMLAGAAHAEDPVRPGEAFATRFSGTIEITLGDGTRLPLIDEDGVVGSLFDLRNPGFAADGRHWVGEPQRMQVTAAEIGQVFGIAFDTGSPSSVLLAASSAFGLHRFDDGSDWLPGQWGEGGPGGLYRLNGANDYAPERLATITLDGRENSGAGLGNVAFDAAHGQIFVSDLETGMIHRLSREGEDQGHYDHGAEARPSFLDAGSGATQTLGAVAFDAASSARLADCTDAAGAAASFDATPACWNFADFRRRVSGLAVFTDPVSGASRLFYAVSGADGLGNPDWAGAGDDAVNSIWSVGLSASGDFDRTSVRREALLPAPVDPDAPASVPDLAISPEGVMLVAERGAARNLGLDAPQPFATPHVARVLRYVLADTGKWEPQGRHDVGFYDRKTDGQPFLRANAAGGVDFGYGYDTQGALDAARPAATAWMSGDALCSPDGACVDPASGGRSDPTEVHGLQGTPDVSSSEVEPAGAREPYPPSGDPYPADGLLSSYLVDLDANLTQAGSPDRIQALKDDSTKIGDVEVYKAAASAAQAVLPAVEPQGYDLELAKTGPDLCLPGTSCTFTITITNHGPDDFAGALSLWDVIEPFDAPMAGFSGEGWQCFAFAGGIYCGIDELTLGLGQSTDLIVTLDVPGGYSSDVLTNCASITRLYGDDGDYDVRSVQIALTVLGYDPGPIDGVTGGRTRQAIAAFQSDNGLAPTGIMDEETALILAPGMAGSFGDLDPSNDSDCHDVLTGDPLPVHTKWKSHLKIGSPHQKIQSHLKIGSPHQKIQSHLKIGSPHQKIQSHLKIGSPHQKIQSHLKTGSPHNKIQSHLKIGSPHNKIQSHLKTGSPHNKIQSHLKTGSPHNKIQSHLKTGSPHNKIQSHLKTGSPHNKIQSHLKTGSPHNKILSNEKVTPTHSVNQSHLKIGSPHSKILSNQKLAPTPRPTHSVNQSHLKTGSPHNKILSNQKLAPLHTKEKSATDPGPVIQVPPRLLAPKQ